jgi:transposase
MNALQKKLSRADSIQPSIDQKTNGPFEYNHKRRQNMKKAMKRVLCKMKNQLRDAHHKISRFLCESYDTLLLPDYKSREMVETGKRRFKAKQQEKC